jgi:hemoglobin/transferrin/lactoferrin receptor protein
MRTRLFIFLLSIGFNSLIAQEILVKNIRTDEPLENVAIFNQHMDKSTITDENGVASIGNFNKTDTLFFQHPSYERYKASYTSVVMSGIIMLERKNILIPEFVITASKYRENKREVPYLIDVISPQRIEYSPLLNSAELLTSSGNIFVQKSQAGGGSPVLRGFEANKVLLVIDGVRMNNAIYRSGHLQNSLTIDNAILERVEVIYGPTSVMYGSDALGGVVHYITKNPELGDSIQPTNIGGTAYIQGASATSSIKSHLDFNLGFKKLAFLSSITHSSYGDIQIGYRRNPFYGDWGKQLDYVERINGKDSLVKNSNSHRIRGTGFNQFDLLQKIRYQPGSYADLVLNIQYSTSSDINRQDQLNDRSENGSPEFSEWYYGPQNRLLAMGKISLSKPNDFYDNFETTIAYQEVEESRNTRGFRDDTLYSQVEKVKIISANIDFHKELTSRTTVGYGFELNLNDVTSEATANHIVTKATWPSLTRYPDEGTQTVTSGAYVSYKARLHPKILTSVGIRYQYYSLKSKYSDLFGDLPEIFRDVEIENQAITSSLSFIINQTRSFNWNVIFATGFRSPNLDDLAKIRLYSGKLTLPNESLEPEYAYNAEVGFSKTFDGYIRINGNYFFTYLTNAITRVPYVSPNGDSTIYFQGKEAYTYQNANSSEALLHGFSLNMISDLNSNISFKGTLNYTYGRNLSEKAPLSHIPPVFGRTEISYQIKKLVFEAYLIYAGWKNIDDMVDTGEDKIDEGTVFGFPGWYTINLNTIYNLTDYLTIQLAAENVTDNFYKPFASGVPAPGINLVGTLRVKF